MAKQIREEFIDQIFLFYYKHFQAVTPGYSPLYFINSGESCDEPIVTRITLQGHTLESLTNNFCPNCAVFLQPIG